jgi:hypothetical protein
VYIGLDKVLHCVYYVTVITNKEYYMNIPVELILECVEPYHITFNFRQTRVFSMRLVSGYYEHSISFNDETMPQDDWQWIYLVNGMKSDLAETMSKDAIQ